MRQYTGSRFCDSYVSIDLETCGFQEGILEIGALKIVDRKPAGEYEQLVRPRVPIERGAQMVHHITMDMVRDKPFFTQICGDLLDFIGDLPLIGYNILDFDLRFLRREFRDAGIRFEPEIAADVLHMAQRFLPELPSKRLEAVAQHLHVADSERHRGLSDAWDCARVYESLKIMNRRRQIYP